MAVLVLSCRFTHPRMNAFLLFHAPNNSNVMSSNKAAKLIRIKIKSTGNK
jgi:hypothetical protein